MTFRLTASSDAKSESHKKFHDLNMAIESISLNKVNSTHKHTNAAINTTSQMSEEAHREAGAQQLKSTCKIHTYTAIHEIISVSITYV